MRCYRIRRTSLTQQPEPRAILLQAVEIRDHGTRACVVIEGIPLFELLSVDQVLDAMDLTRDDVEPCGA